VDYYFSGAEEFPEAVAGRGIFWNHATVLATATACYARNCLANCGREGRLLNGDVQGAATISDARRRTGMKRALVWCLSRGVAGDSLEERIRIA